VNQAPAVIFVSLGTKQLGATARSRVAEIAYEATQQKVLQQGVLWHADAL
jgi:hypothetical protein